LRTPAGQRSAPTLKDVARAAGVSISTASRALAQPHMVSPVALRNVERAAKKLGYIAQAAGRMLSSKRSRTVGAILPDLDNAIFANTAHALQKRLAEQDYMLVLACNDYSRSAELNLARTLLERGVDALVLTGIEHDPQLLQQLRAAALPVVFTWAFTSRPQYTCVGFDNAKAGALIASHIAQLGHTQVAILTAYTQYTERHLQRLKSCRSTLQSHGIEVPEQWIIESKLDYASGREGVRQLFAYSNPPTAVICSNDIIAIGAMAECQQLGLRVPEDVSIGGFEDLAVASHVRPALTTVRWSQRDLGRRAAEAVLGLLSGERDKVEQIEVPVELIVRGTTAPPRSAAAHKGAKLVREVATNLSH